MIKENFLKLMLKYSNNEGYNLECWDEIENKYSSKSRHYHNLEHLENMFMELRKVESQVEELDTLLFAIYYHDIIYKSTKSDNEHQSAILLKKRLSKTSFVYIQECMTLIELTKEHKLSTHNDTNILLDLDLLTLGKSPVDYEKYCNSIRKEYQIYPDFMYRRGRKKVLKAMLDLDSIYKTDYFKLAYETKARENLKAEVKQLS